MSRWKMVTDRPESFAMRPSGAPRYPYPSPNGYRTRRARLTGPELASGIRSNRARWGFEYRNLGAKAPNVTAAPARPTNESSSRLVRLADFGLNAGQYFVSYDTKVRV